MAELPLAKDFPLASEAAWQALVEEALKGAPFASLRSKTYDGIEIEPLYPRANDASVIPGRAAGVPWTVMQRADIADPEAANKQILADLNNGATGLALVFEGAIGDYGYALEATGAALSQALDGVYLDAGVDIELDLGRPSKHAAGLLATLVKARGLDPGTLNIRFGFNPLGAIATTGESPKPWPDIAANFANYIAEIADPGLHRSLRRAPTGDRSTPQVALRRRSLPSRWPAPSPISARWKRMAFRSKTRAIPSSSASPPTRISS